MNKTALPLIAVGLSLAFSIKAYADITLYSNGSFNGQLGSFEINNSANTYSDSFPLSGPATVNSVKFAAYTHPYGATVTQVDWWITSLPNAGTGTTYGSGTADVSDAYITTNSGDAYGGLGNGDLNEDSFSTGPVSLAAGTYYLTLWNGQSIFGWDINNGPSSAYSSQVAGSVNQANSVVPGTDSNSFEVDGVEGLSTPEPDGPISLSIGALLVVLFLVRRRAKHQPLRQA